MEEEKNMFRDDELFLLITCMNSTSVADLLRIICKKTL